MDTKSLIKRLREETGAGMMECSKAITESEGDYDRAKDIIKERGKALMDKKSGRDTKEGKVGFLSDENGVIAMTLACETEFVANSKSFIDLFNDILRVALSKKTDNVEMLTAETKELMAGAMAALGENIVISEAVYRDLESRSVYHYIHTKVANSDNIGKVVALVIAEADQPLDSSEVGKRIAMHIASAKPVCLTAEQLSADIIERERAIFIEQAKSTGKPENVIQKIVEGKIASFQKGVVLLEQEFIMDSSKKIKDVIQEENKKAKFDVVDFIHLKIGNN